MCKLCNRGRGLDLDYVESIHMSNTLCIWPDSKHTKFLHHPKQKRRMGGGLRQINTSRQVPLLVKPTFRIWCLYRYLVHGLHQEREITQSGHSQINLFKGIVQPFKTGVMGGIIRSAFKFSSFPQFFQLFLKDPGPLNSKKRFSAAKQLSLGQVSIMWRPLQNAL